MTTVWISNSIQCCVPSLKLKWTKSMIKTGVNHPFVDDELASLEFRVDSCLAISFKCGFSLVTVDLLEWERYPFPLTHLTEFPVLDILLPVEEPVGDFVLARILHDGHHALYLRNTKRSVQPQQLRRDVLARHSAAQLTSSSVSSPALLLRSMSAFLRTTWA